MKLNKCTCGSKDVFITKTKKENEIMLYHVECLNCGKKGTAVSDSHVAATLWNNYHSRKSIIKRILHFIWR